MTGRTHTPTTPLGLLTALALACAPLLAGCPLAADFDVRVVEEIDLSELAAEHLGGEGATIQVAGGVDIPVMVWRYADMRTDESFADMANSSGELELISVTYEVTENTSNTTLPQLRVTTYGGLTRLLENTHLIATIPEVPPRKLGGPNEVDWVEGGREIFTDAVDATEFTLMLSTTLHVPEGAPLPTGRVQIEFLVRGRTPLN